MNCVSPMMDVNGLPDFRDSCQQRSTIVLCWLSLVLGYFKKWPKVTWASQRLAKLFESTYWHLICRFSFEALVWKI